MKCLGLENAIRDNLNRTPSSNRIVLFRASSQPVKLTSESRKILVWVNNEIVAYITPHLSRVWFTARDFTKPMIHAVFTAVLSALGLSQIVARVMQKDVAPKKKADCVVFFHQEDGEIGFDEIFLNYGDGHYTDIQFDSDFKTA